MRRDGEAGRGVSGQADEGCPATVEVGQGVGFGTVVTASHLPYAMALAAALERHHPEAFLTVLLLDPEFARGREGLGHLRLVTPGEVGIPGFADMTMRYSAFELSCRVKPFLVSHLLRRGHEKVILLDSDIFVVGRFDAMIRALDRAFFVLTAHLNRIDLVDRSVVSLTQFTDLGFYNGGLWGVRRDERAGRLLALLEGFLSDTRLEFADQRVLPVAAHFAADGFHCLRDPGYNVAYWNLHERPLARQNGRFLADGQPVTFFHLSGFDAAVPERLSRYWPADRPVPALVDEVLRSYAELLPKRPDLTGLGYGYGRVGTRAITPAMRRYYVEHGTFEGFRRHQAASLVARGLRALGRRVRGV